MGRWLVEVKDRDELEPSIARIVDAETWLGAVTGAMEVIPVAKSSGMPVVITAVPVR